MSRSKYFNDASITGTGWTQFSFGFNPSTLISIAADSTNSDDVYISWDGQTTHYRLKAGEPFNITNDFINGVYLKPKSGTQKARVFAY